MKNTLKYYLIKIRLILWIAGLITRNSEAVIALNGGKWDRSMRAVALEMLLANMLAEVRDG